jgi:hypothetical protein
MLENGRILSIGCEDLEDLVLWTASGPVLVSVKHREPSRGPWTLTELCDGGGLAHLFDRWIAASDITSGVKAIHVTNGGLKTGEGQPKKLSDLCGSESASGVEFDTFAMLLTHHFLMLRGRGENSFVRIPDAPVPARATDLSADDSTVLLCVEFMKALSFVDVPHREQIGAVNVQERVMPYFQQRGLDGYDAKPGYEALVDHIERASRSFGTRRIDLVYSAAMAGTSVADVQRASRIAARTVTAQAALAALLTGSASPLFPTGSEPLDAPGGADLRRKMREGGLSHTEQRFAERTRSAWYTTWNAHRLDLPGDAATLASLKLQVLEQVIDAQRGTLQLADGYGPSLLSELRRNVRVDRFSSRPQLRLNDAHALGVAFDLCDECDFDFRPVSHVPPTSWSAP